MTIKSLIYALPVFFLSCGGVTEEPLELSGEIRGKITQLTEYGSLDLEQGGATFILQTPSSTFQTQADPTGNYVLKNVPIGTYDMIVEKPGFGTFRSKGFQFVGGEEAAYSFVSLSRTSTTTVTNLSLSYQNGAIHFSGTGNYNDPLTSYTIVFAVAFLGNSQDVSPDNHTYSILIPMPESPGSDFSITSSMPSGLFPQGSTVFAVVYGISIYGSLFFDPDTRRYNYPGLGTVPSNVASVKIQ